MGRQPEQDRKAFHQRPPCLFDNVLAGEIPGERLMSPGIAAVLSNPSGGLFAGRFAGRGNVLRPCAFKDCFRSLYLLRAV